MCLPLKPYKIEREWEYEGLKCAVVQNREASNRCGYVRVPEGHPAWGRPYSEVDQELLPGDVPHGGLTYGNYEDCEEEDGQGYWLGFDCAHAGDLMVDPEVKLEDIRDPAVRRSAQFFREHPINFLLDQEPHFWTQAEVEREVEKLAEFLVRLGEFADAIKRED
jgi:hypothetical protein